MLLDILLLVVALFVILLSSELFTNGVEWLGQRLKLNEGVVGSVLAAVGTALPETLIPFVAVLFFGSRHGQDVGIGAIAGAPFMLSTLTLALCGWTIWYYALKGRRRPGPNINATIIGRDLSFFIAGYTLAVVAAAASDIPPVRWLIALILLGCYALYLHRTLCHEGDVGEAPEHLHFARMLNRDPTMLRFIAPQVLIGLAGIMGGAYIFVDHVESLATDLGMAPVVLSLVVAPIATELPEKVNSVLWARNGKDTLALGNVTGALVFQSCFPVAFGVAFTSWKLTGGTVATALVAIGIASMHLYLIKKAALRPHHLMCGVVAYIVTVGYLLITGNQP